MAECHVCESNLSEGDDVLIAGRNEAYFCSARCLEKDIKDNAEDYAFNIVHGPPIKIRKTTLREDD
jgi:hypothetical protein